MVLKATGAASISGTSSDINRVASAAMIVLKIRIEKKLRNTMDKSFAARMSPSSSMLLKYASTR